MVVEGRFMKALEEMLPKLGHMVNAINQEGHTLAAALHACVAPGPPTLHVLD